MEWRQRSACKTEDPELFFPIGTGGLSLLQTAEAKSICRGCPVVSECLKWAFDHEIIEGIWGGQSEDERTAQMRQSARMLFATA